MAKTIPLKFWNFLLEVDVGVQRDEAFLQTAAGAFMNNSTADVLDLVGFEVSDAKKGVAHAGCSYVFIAAELESSGTIPDAGIAAFMRRAVAKANEK